MKKRVLNKNILTNVDLIDVVADKVATKGENILEIPVGKARVKKNVRKEYKEESIRELAESIKEKGLLQPITVAKAEDGFYDILFGHRRFKAVLYLNEKYPNEYAKIQCIVKERGEFDPAEVVEIQLIENIQRENLSASELKESLTKLKEKGLTHKQIADKLGKSEGYVKNIFMTIKAINENKSLSQLVEGHPGVTLKDIQAVKPLPTKQQIKLIEQKIKGEIKTRAQLEQKVQEARGKIVLSNRTDYNRKKAFDILTVKPDNTIKVRSFKYEPAKSTPAETKKLLSTLRDLIAKIEGGTKK